jgi:hypothetical protein
MSRMIQGITHLNSFFYSKSSVKRTGRCLHLFQNQLNAVRRPCEELRYRQNSMGGFYTWLITLWTPALSTSWEPVPGILASGGGP